MASAGPGLSVVLSGQQRRSIIWPSVQSFLHRAPIFADQPPAYFSPDVPASLQREWHLHGGRIVPHFPVTLHIHSSHGAAIPDKWQQLLAAQQDPPCLAFFDHDTDSGWLHEEQARGGGRVIQPVYCRLITCAIIAEDADILDEPIDELRLMDERESTSEMDEDWRDEAEVDEYLELALPDTYDSDPSAAQASPEASGRAASDPSTQIDREAPNFRPSSDGLLDDMNSRKRTESDGAELRRKEGFRAPARSDNRRGSHDNCDPSIVNARPDIPHNRHLPTLPSSPVEQASSSPDVTDTWTHTTGSQLRQPAARASTTARQYKVQFCPSRHASAPIDGPDSPTPQSRSSSSRVNNLQTLRIGDASVYPSSRATRSASPSVELTSPPDPFVQTPPMDTGSTVEDRKFLVGIDIPTSLVSADMSPEERRQVCDMFLQDTLRDLNHRAAGSPFRLDAHPSPPALQEGGWSSHEDDPEATDRDHWVEAVKRRMRIKRDEVLNSIMGSSPAPAVGDERPARSEHALAAAASRRPLKVSPANDDGIMHQPVRGISTFRPPKPIVKPAPEPVYFAARRGSGKGRVSARRHIADVFDGPPIRRPSAPTSDTEVDEPVVTSSNKLESDVPLALDSFDSSAGSTTTPVMAPATQVASIISMPNASSSASSPVNSHGSSDWSRKIPPSGTVSSTDTSTDLGYFPSTESISCGRSRYGLRARQTRKRALHQELGSVTSSCEMSEPSSPMVKAEHPNLDWRGRAAIVDDGRMMSMLGVKDMGMLGEELSSGKRAIKIETSEEGAVAAQAGKRARRDFRRQD